MKAEVGHEFELVKKPTTRTLVQYAGASGDFYEIHYDQDYARSIGLPGVILHGLLQAGFLGQLVTDFAGNEARLKTFEVSYRGMAQPARPFTCKGVVKAVDGKDVQLEIWGEDADGKKTVIGSATLERR
jgi:hydroxyacyl-ACP dehydratase HTD2-like protein with hotdog domain